MIRAALNLPAKATLLAAALGVHAGLLAVLPGMPGVPGAATSQRIVRLVPAPSTPVLAASTEPSPAQAARRGGRKTRTPQPSLVGNPATTAIPAEPVPMPMLRPVVAAPTIHNPNQLGWEAQRFAGAPTITAQVSEPPKADNLVGTAIEVAPDTARPLPAPPVKAEDTSQLLASYRSLVLGRIKAQQRYPARAEEAGVQGSVKLNFTLAADGSLLGASVASGSGSGDLDGAALAAVKAAAPFAPIPLALQRDSARLSVTLRFMLGQ